MLVVNPPIFLVDKKVISNYNFVASLTLRFKDRCFPVNFVKFLTLVVRSIFALWKQHGRTIFTRKNLQFNGPTVIGIASP